MRTSDIPIGLLLGGTGVPEQVPRLAGLGEDLGFREMWVVEDYFYSGGLSTATAVLASTKRALVGFGIVSAVTRHPALLAMEIATMSRIYPGRLRPGIGLGLPDWLRQMNLYPHSMLTAMRECINSVRKLLAGEEVNFRGEVFGFDRIKLAHPPTENVPLDMGVAGPKMVQLAGEIADGLVIGLNASPQYVSWARDQLSIGAARSARTSHRVTCFAIFSMDKNSAKAKAAARGLVSLYLALGGRNAMTDAYGITDELLALLARGGADAVQRDMPDNWLEDVAIVGEPDECASKIRRYFESGADAIVLYPQPLDRAEELLKLTSTELLPRLR